MGMFKKKKDVPPTEMKEENAIPEPPKPQPAKEQVLLNYHEEMLIGTRLVLEELQKITELLQKATED